MNYWNFFNASLANIKLEGRYRVFQNLERCAGEFPYAIRHTSSGEQKVIIWCGNDYLGMGQNPDVIKAMIEAIQRMGTGSGGTRNISGTTHPHVLLEKEIADLHDQEAALVFTSGYVANETTLSTLGASLPGCVILSDAHNHASMIEGIRHSRAEKIIFKHNDYHDLETHLQKIDPARPKIVAFESVYSMEGDIAPIQELAEVARNYNALVYLDEVHGVGMYGHKGGGIAQMRGISHLIDITQGTLGKAYGLIGGYIAGKSLLVDFIRSKAPGFIFTTSLPPALVAGAVTSVHHLKYSHMEREQHQLNVAYLKRKVEQSRIPYLESESHIVSVIVGEAKRCKEVAERLLEDYNIYAQPINYPTVPKGTERLRLTPSALHSFEMIDELVDAFTEIWDSMDLRKAA
ncbi:MAG: 5-aminolevulinate synthase [Caedimonas sp.]|nr:5-aminolevulinate synthase [Caedimonas sp.]